jgi:hypothetical protein
VLNDTTARTFTIDDAIFSAGDTIQVHNIDTGVLTIAAGSGVTLNGADVLTVAQYQGGTIYFTSASSAIFFPTAKTVSAGGLVFVAGASFTTSLGVNVNNVFTSTYRNYKIIIEGEGSESGGSFIDMRMRVGGTDNSGANYFYSYHTVNASSTGADVGAGSQTVWRVFNAANLRFGCDITITGPQLTDEHNFNALFATAGTGIGITGRSGGTFNAATSFDGFSLIPVSGTITGTYRVYGLADS